MVKIQVLDVNDNYPIFYPKEYKVSVEENIIPLSKGKSIQPAPIVIVAATDKDSSNSEFGAIRYEIKDGNDEAAFEIDSIEGKIFIVRPLSSAKPFHQLTIIAKDGGGKVSQNAALVHVSVLPRGVPSQAASPTFSQRQYNFVIQENSSPGTQVGVVEAISSTSDPTHLTYATYSGDPDGYFSIDSKKGIIRVNSGNIDHEKHSSLLLNIQAKEGAAPGPYTYGHIQVNITILDVNDNYPTFAADKLKISVPENTPTYNVTVFIAHAFDQDSGLFGKITYSIVEKGENKDSCFAINETDGAVYLKSPLDYEIQNHYQLEVTATDGGGLSNKLMIDVDIQDVNDNSPKFVNTLPISDSSEPSYKIEISESLPLNSHIFQVRATDDDTGNNARLTYSLINDPLSEDVFAIFPNNGMIYLKKPLDRETKDSYHLTIKVNDHGSSLSLSASAKMTIKILDANDNRPVFTSKDWTFSISEDAPLGIFIGQISATDADLGNNCSLRYNISNGFIYESNLFRLNPVTGKIYLKALLDREIKDRYIFKVEVHDQGTPYELFSEEKSTIIIDVLDINDNSPTFVGDETESELQKLIPLGSPEGTFITTVKAIDPDNGSNGTVYYSLVDSEHSKWFKIGKTSGIIKTNRKIEEVSSYQVGIKAIDGGGNKSQVKFIKIDVVQKKTKLPGTGTSVDNVKSYEFEVKESLEIGQKIGSIIIDIEKLNNFEAYFECSNGYYIMFENHKELDLLEPLFPFVIESNDKQTLNLILSSKLDFETKSEYNFFIFIDFWQCTMIISSSDFKSRERFKNYHLIANIKVSVEDDYQDCSPFSAIYNEIKEQNVSMFEIKVTVNEETIHQKAINIYSLQVISSLDCSKLNLIFKIESMMLSQEIVNQLLTITDQGLIQLRPFDKNLIQDLLAYRELLIVIKVFIEMNNRLVPIDSLIAKINFIQEDENIDQVNFINPEYLSFDEDCCSKFENIFQVRLNLSSSDFDVQFSLKEQDSKGKRIFTIEPETGLVSLLDTFDFESVSEYKLNISAVIYPKVSLSTSSSRNPKPSLSLSAPLSPSTPTLIKSISKLFTIQINDVNDEKPVFLFDNYSTEVLETVKLETVLTTIQAKDLDFNSVLTYLIPSRHESQKYFKIDSKSGEVKTVGLLDREKKAVHVVPIFVFDNDFKHFEKTYLTVKVIDVNDNAPVFSNPNQSIKILENILPGTDFHTLIAFDEDLLTSNSSVTGLIYKIIAGNEDKKFKIDENHGILQTVGTLDRETKEHYNLTIQVSDSAYNSYCNLFIDLIDLNDNSPVFEKNLYQVTLDSNDLIGKDVIKDLITIKAVDPDLDNKVYYSINVTSSPVAIYFTIDSSTGLISTSSAALIQAQKIARISQNLNGLGHLSTSQNVSFAFEVLVMDIEKSLYAAHTAQATIQVTISNRDDLENPRLSAYPYVIEARGYKEGYRVGHEIGQIELINYKKEFALTSINFRIRDENPNLRFSDYFILDSKSGSISVKRPLVSDYYECLLEVEKINSSFSTLAMVQIVFTGDGSNDVTQSKNVKVFNYKVDLYENVPQGTEVINLVTKSKLATLKTGDYEFELAYSSTNQSYFKLDLNTGSLMVKKVLDYETDPSTIEMMIIAKNKQHPFNNLIFFNVTLFLLNVIDNAPKFTQHHYIATVKEGEAKGTFVTQLSALDLENFSKMFQNSNNKRDKRSSQSTLTYHILEGNHDNAFAIIPSSSGIVRTNIVLDREIRDHYSLKIVANDNGNSNFQLSSHCTLEIKVIDINDNVPIFPPYQEISISEDSKIGSVVTSITANDVDTFPPLTYYKHEASSSSTINEANNLFEIGLYTGKITLKSRLNDLSKISYSFQPKEYKFHILASDSLHTIETQVVVKVREASIYKKSPLFINDSLLVYVNPRTHPCIYIGSTNCEISQLEALSTRVMSKVKIAYRIASQSDKGFYIDNTRGVIYNNRSLRESQSQLYQLTVLAEYVHENGRSFGALKARCSVIVNVRGYDANLNETSVTRDEKTYYSIEITKDSFGQSLLKLDDSGSKVTLRIINGNYGNVFAIRRNKELIKVRKSIRNEYRLEIEKKRELEPNKFDITMITVKVKIIGEDKESRSAAFKSKILDVDVREDVALGHFVINVKKKEENDNKKYYYQISSGNEANRFKINQTSGKLVINQHLDYSTQNYYYLSVTAFREPQRTFEAICIININVLNVNDNLPKFALTHYKAVVEENSPIGSKVLKLGTVNLNDFKINYTLTRTLEGGVAPFVFDQKNGYLITSEIIDYESMDIYSPPIYKLVLKASKSKNSFTEVLIEVMISSVDEFAPKFQTESYQFKVTTSFGVPRVKVGQVTAIDLDAGPDGQVIYTLRSSSPASALSKFHLNSSTGVMTINTAAVDQIPPQYSSLIISASSGRTESLSSLTVVEVTLTLFEDKFSIGNAYTSSPASERERDTFIKSTASTNSNQTSTLLPGWILFLIVFLMLITVVLLVSVVVIRLHQHQQHHDSIANDHGIGNIVSGVGSLLRKIGTNRSNIPTLDRNTPFDATTISSLHHHRRHLSHHSKILVHPSAPPPCYNEITLVNQSNSSSGIVVTSEDLSASSGRGSAEDEYEVEGDLEDVDEEVRMINEGNEYFTFGLDNRLGSTEFVSTRTEYFARLGIRDTSNEDTEKNNDHMKQVANPQTFLNSKQISKKIAQNESQNWYTASQAEEELSDAYNWDYLQSWGPKYQPLSSVFTEIARLKGAIPEINGENEESNELSSQSKLEELETVSNKSGPILGTQNPHNCQVGLSLAPHAYRLSRLRTMPFSSHSAFQPFSSSNVQLEHPIISSASSSDGSAATAVYVDHKQAKSNDGHSNC